MNKKEGAKKLKPNKQIIIFNAVSLIVPLMLLVLCWGEREKYQLEIMFSIGLLSAIIISMFNALIRYLAEKEKQLRELEDELLKGKCIAEAVVFLAERYESTTYNEETKDSLMKLADDGLPNYQRMLDLIKGGFLIGDDKKRSILLDIWDYQRRKRECLQKMYEAFMEAKNNGNNPHIVVEFLEDAKEYSTKTEEQIEKVQGMR